MSQPFIGEIRMFGGSFAPAGWAFCSGQLVAISQNDALFTLIGTTYGGDGESTFALPDLQGRFPMHQGNNHIIGEKGGVETVTLTVQQLPAHTHPAQALNAIGTQAGPLDAVWAGSIARQFSASAPNGAMAAAAITPAGGSQPHDNMSPYLVISFIISLFGIFPTQN